VRFTAISFKARWWPSISSTRHVRSLSAPGRQFPGVATSAEAAGGQRRAPRVGEYRSADRHTGLAQRLRGTPRGGHRLDPAHGCQIPCGHTPQGPRGLCRRQDRPLDLHSAGQRTGGAMEARQWLHIGQHPGHRTARLARRLLTVMPVRLSCCRASLSTEPHEIGTQTVLAESRISVHSAISKS
jgi:hypothetical protein